VRFSVAELFHSAAGASRVYDVSEDITDIDEDLAVLTPLAGEIRLMRTDSGILVIGHLGTQVRLACRRCGILVSVPVEVEIEEEFLPSVEISTGAAIPSEDGEDEAIRTDGKHILDLTEVIRQDLWLAMPTLPLCSPQCRGLCPHCGANLNEGPCGCQHQGGEPRLAVLRGLL